MVLVNAVFNIFLDFSYYKEMFPNQAKLSKKIHVTIASQSYLKDNLRAIILLKKNIECWVCL